MDRRETNIEFVTRLMTQPRSGPLMHAVVIHALIQFSRIVIQAPKGFMGEDKLISEAAWRACAQELHDELEKFLDS
ncbi:hypothetical protein N5O88_10175 [Pseudomonas sp. GD03721]|nr:MULTISPECIES: hypothetical protein [unclassified Pseudomonas]MDH1440368.1 hypothetical protein [Pseudomonas sp. GD03722]WGG03542.1 hypothetical protein N5O88_10175 [Pseudomonas sp. GD03721]WGG07710.1 hypothetical protein N5O87_10185 [Pseudomonas sp. GD03919]